MPTDKKVTLKDIAEKAGVSTALVSCILNGKGRASEGVRARVLELLEEAGYRPKYARRSFYFLLDLQRITESQKTVPVMQMLKGVEQALEDEGVHLQVEFVGTTGGERVRSTGQQLEGFIAARPGALLVRTDEQWLDKACAIAEKAGIPLMQLGYDTENPRYPAVVVDSFAGAYAGVQHLLRKGHRRIATLRWTYDLSGVNSNKKYAGYRSALTDAGIEPRPEYVRALAVGQSDPQWRPARALVDELLALREPPTALFVENSAIGLSLLYPLPTDGGTLPREIGNLDMVHFEDWPLDPIEDIVAGKLFYPRRRLTALAIDWEAIGRYAARSLVDRVRGTNQNGTGTIRIAPVLQAVDGTTRTVIDAQQKTGHYEEHEGEEG